MKQVAIVAAALTLTGCNLTLNNPNFDTKVDSTANVNATANTNVNANVNVNTSGNPSSGPSPAGGPATSTGPTGKAAVGSWSKVSGLQRVNDAEFVSPTKGWVLDWDMQASTVSIKAYSEGAGFTTQFTTPSLLNSVSINGPIGLAGGGQKGTLLRTDDGGQKWTLTDWDGAGESEIYAVKLLDTKIALMTTGRGLFRSDDGGKTWTNTGLESSQNALFHTENGKVFLSSGLYDGAFLNAASFKADRSIDGGRFTSVTFPDPNKPLSGWATAYDGSVGADPKLLFTTQDGGKTWTNVKKLNLGTEFKEMRSAEAIAFCSPNNGILLTFSFSGDGTAPYYVTADGGQTWSQGIADSQLSLSKKLYYFEDGTGWNLSNNNLYRYSN